jgi:hypothetical protein
LRLGALASDILCACRAGSEEPAVQSIYLHDKLSFSLCASVRNTSWPYCFTSDSIASSSLPASAHLPCAESSR